MSHYDHKYDLRIHEGALHVELFYPGVEDEPVKAIQIGLCDVRAADDIRVSYDFERDGWVIQQASKAAWQSGEDLDWAEVAFVRAWGREAVGVEVET